MVNKYDKLETILKETGEVIEKDIVKNIIMEDERKEINILQLKFEQNNISRNELLKLMKYKKMNETINLLYDDFYRVNLSKEKPKEVSKSDYGGFFMLLNYITYKNTIAHRNGRHVSIKKLAEELEFKTIDGFKKFLRKLKKCNMIGTANFGGIDFILINPVYAQRKVKLNHTIYTIFKNDLKEYLNDFQIRLLELENDDTCIETIIPIID